MSSSNPFKWRHYEPEIILLCVRTFLELPAQLSTSSRDGDGSGAWMFTTQQYIGGYSSMRSYLEKRCRPDLCPTNNSWRVDETYIKIQGKDRYLYRAVDSQGKTIDFLLTAHRDAEAAKRFLCKALKAVHTSRPRVINVDKNAAYPQAINELKEKEELLKKVELRQNKYLTTLIGVCQRIRAGYTSVSTGDHRTHARSCEWLKIFTAESNVVSPIHQHCLSTEIAMTMPGKLSD